MINTISHLLDHSTLSIVINSLVFTLSYCSFIWSGTSKCNISKLQLVQNFTACILSGKKKYEYITIYYTHIETTSTTIDIRRIAFKGRYYEIISTSLLVIYVY